MENLEVREFFGLFQQYLDAINPKNCIMKQDRARFLGHDVQFNLSEKTSKKHICIELSYHLTKFLQKEGFKIKDEKNYEWCNGKYNYEQPSYKNFITSANKEDVVSIPWRTTLFYEGPFKLVLEFGFWGEGSENGYKLSSTEEDKDKLTKLFKEYEEYLKSDNIFKNSKLSYSNGTMEFLGYVNRNFDTVVLSDEIKSELKINIINLFHKTDFYRKHNIPLKRGVVFSGPPGCGKTSVIEALCTELKGAVTTIFVTCKSIENTSDIAKVYEYARNLSPSLVIFEDIDCLGGNRSAGEYSPFIGELLNQLDGAVPNDQIVTIATTNHIKKLDAALSNRPSRFDRNILFDLPDLSLRKEIFTQYLSNHAYDDSITSNLKSIAYDLNDMSGAQIKEVLISATLYAMSLDDSEDIVLNYEHIKEGIVKTKNNFDGAKGVLGFTMVDKKESLAMLNKSEKNPKTIEG